MDAPFRPRRARLVALPAGFVLLAAAVFFAVVMPTTGDAAWGPVDRLAVVALGAAAAWFCWRQATVTAVPGADGLLVRNLVLSRRLQWAEIVSVRFGDGRPWVQLDLSDGDTLAVMGIQASDGARAMDEARRLAALVAARSQPDQPTAG